MKGNNYTYLYMQTEVCDGTMDGYVLLFWQDGWDHQRFRPRRVISKGC